METFSLNAVTRHSFSGLILKDALLTTLDTSQLIRESCYQPFWGSATLSDFQRLKISTSFC